jgi:uncharacterized protein YbaP (TraB family)
MKRFLLIFLAFTSFGQTIDKDHELLWEISKKGVKEKSYLFGTLHSNDKRLFNFTDSTYYALNKSKRIVLEADVFSLFGTLDTRRSEISLNYDNTGEPYTSDAYSTETVYGDEDGAPQFVDAYFQQYCYNANKDFSPLETVQSQFDLFSNVNLPDFTQMRLESFLTSKEQMVELYLEGDIYGLDQLLRRSLTVYPDLYQEMIIDRNKLMVEVLDSLIIIEGTFCAVGAGHLAGSTGLINLLRSKGYSVRKVLATYTSPPICEKQKVRTANHYIYRADSLEASIRFPGKPLEIREENEDFIVKLIYRDLGQGNSYEVEIYERNLDVGLADLAKRYIASPAESTYEQIQLDNGGEAFQGLADSYPIGLHWTRIVMGEATFMVIKTYGGNKFMNSSRPFRFFDQIIFE